MFGDCILFKDKRTARQKIDLLIEHLSITNIDSSVVEQVKNNKYIHDFEDGLEYYSAIAQKCDRIITRDKEDFYFSKITVMDAESVIRKNF